MVKKGTSGMKISRFTEEQIIAAIRSQVSGHKTVELVCRELGRVMN
jgi:hypothetical protein